MKIRVFKEKGVKEYYMKNFNLKENKKIVFLGVIALLLVITVLCSFQTIQSGEVGLRVRFGKIIDSNLREGFNLKIPYIEDIVKVNIKVQKVELETSAASRDLQDISTRIAVNYRVQETKASSLYKTVGNSYEKTVLEPVIEESVKSVISKYTAEETITKRSEVSNESLQVLQEKVEKYGIVIDNFNIINLAFSDEYSRAIEEKQVAEQKLATARLESEAKLVEAEATKKANELLKQSLTDELIEKEFIEKWDGKLPETYAGNDILGIFKTK